MGENAAIVFPEAGTVTIEDRDVPEPDANQLLIETTRTLVSTGTELALLTGASQYGSFPIAGPGYSNVGEVVDVGSAVDEAWLGARVATGAPHRQYVVADAESATAIPDGVSDEAATFHAIAAIAMNGVRRGRVSWGETVAVYGLGLVGQMAARICHVAGAAPTVGLDIAESRLEYFPDRPGMIGIDPDTETPRDRVGDETDGRLADVVFEVTANVDAIPEQFELLRDQGRFVVLSSPRETGEFDYYRHCHRPGYEIIGAHARTHPSQESPDNQWTRARHRELFFRLLAEGRIDVEPMISHRARYRRGPERYEMLLEDRTRALGVVMEW